MNKTPQQQALERSDLWKLYLAIKANPGNGVLLNMAREANAEFVRNLLPPSQVVI